MFHQHLTSVKLDINPEELQNVLLQAQVNAIANPIIGPQWVSNQSPELVDEGPETVTITFSASLPCKFDHNGECLVCDCWLSDCAYKRYLKEDYTYESKAELERMFENDNKNPQNKQ